MDRICDPRSSPVSAQCKTLVPDPAELRNTIQVAFRPRTCTFSLHAGLSKRTDEMIAHLPPEVVRSRRLGLILQAKLGQMGEGFVVIPSRTPMFPAKAVEW